MVSLLTAILIQHGNNDIRCEAYPENPEGTLWSGEVNLYREGSLHTTLLSSDPSHPSAEEAVTAMKSALELIRVTDLKESF
jgi:hypothetical protein